MVGEAIVLVLSCVFLVVHEKEKEDEDEDDPLMGRGIVHQIHSIRVLCSF